MKWRLLAAYVVLASAMALLGYSEPRPSYLGIAVLVGAAFIMPALAKEKRRLSAMTGSAALRADAAESALCAYLRGHRRGRDRYFPRKAHEFVISGVP